MTQKANSMLHRARVKLQLHDVTSGLQSDWKTLEAFSLIVSYFIQIFVAVGREKVSHRAAVIHDAIASHNRSYWARLWDLDVISLNQIPPVSPLSVV
jgi:hypothetical protein